MLPRRGGGEEDGGGFGRVAADADADADAGDAQGALATLGSGEYFLRQIIVHSLPEISAPAVGTEVEEGEAVAPPLPPPISTAPTSRKDTDFPLKINV